MTVSSLAYSSFKIVQLRTLYQTYLEVISKYPHISVESQRYTELYKERRPPANAWFLDHNILPQEILERTPEIRQQFDALGTRDCLSGPNAYNRFDECASYLQLLAAHVEAGGSFL